MNNASPAPSNSLLINNDKFSNGPASGLVYGTLEIGSNGTGINGSTTEISGDVLLVSGFNAPTTSVVKISTGGAINSTPTPPDISAGTLLLEAGGNINVLTSAAIVGAKSTNGNIELQANYTDGAGQRTKFSNLSTAAGKYARINLAGVAGGTAGQTKAIVTAGWIDVVGNGNNLKWDNAGNNFEIGRAHV